MGQDDVNQRTRRWQRLGRVATDVTDTDPVQALRIAIREVRAVRATARPAAGCARSPPSKACGPSSRRCSPTRRAPRARSRRSPRRSTRSWPTCTRSRSAARDDRGDGGDHRARAHRDRSPRSPRVAVSPRGRVVEGGHGVRDRREPRQRRSRAHGVARRRAAVSRQRPRRARGEHVSRDRRAATDDLDAWRALDELYGELRRWRELSEVRGELVARADNGVDKAAALRAQARAVEQTGDASGAAELVARAAGHAPEDLSGLVDYVSVLARAGKGREAAALLVERVAEATARGAGVDELAALRARLAGILEDACGDRPAAAAVLEELLAAKPDHLPALERLVWQASHDPDPRVHAIALVRQLGVSSFSYSGRGSML